MSKNKVYIACLHSIDDLGSGTTILLEAFSTKEKAMKYIENLWDEGEWEKLTYYIEGKRYWYRVEPMYIDVMEV